MIFDGTEFRRREVHPRFPSVAEPRVVHEREEGLPAIVHQGLSYERW